MPWNKNLRYIFLPKTKSLFLTKLVFLQISQSLQAVNILLKQSWQKQIVVQQCSNCEPALYAAGLMFVYDGVTFTCIF